MTDSLRVVADSIADTVTQAAVSARDSVDWVVECAYRQAMLIDRVDLWMNCMSWLFWFGSISYVIYNIVGIVFDSKGKKVEKAESGE